MWGRHCGGLGMRLTLGKARFQGAHGPAALCLPGAACSPSCEAARGGGRFPAPRGWSSSLDSHGECREQLQTHKQILLQQAVGKEPGSGLPGCLRDSLCMGVGCLLQRASSREALG